MRPRQDAKIRAVPNSEYFKFMRVPSVKKQLRKYGEHMQDFMIHDPHTLARLNHSTEVRCSDGLTAINIHSQRMTQPNEDQGATSRTPTKPQTQQPSNKHSPIKVYTPTIKKHMLIDSVSKHKQIDAKEKDILFKQTQNFKQMAQFYRLLYKKKSLDQSIYWIMDRETFITGMDRIEYKVFPPSFNMEKKPTAQQNRAQSQTTKYPQFPEHPHENADEIENFLQVQKHSLLTTQFQNDTEQGTFWTNIPDREELEGINRNKIRKYLFETNKLFKSTMYQDGGIGLGLVETRVVPPNEAHLLTLRELFEKSQATSIRQSYIENLESVRESIKEIEKQRNQYRITGYFYQTNKSPNFGLRLKQPRSLS